MQITFLSRFEKDVGNISNKAVASKLITTIMQLENAFSLTEISSIKKLKGHPHAFRLKLFNYRLGFYYENGVIELARILPRKDIYKYFP